MNYIALAVILGIIQGLCEFLPISSSGHLVLAQNLFGLKEPEIFLDLVLHVGTLAAVVIFYRRDLSGLLSELISSPRYLSSKKAFKEAWQTRPDWRLGLLVVLGSIPTAIIGLSTKKYLEPLFASVTFVGGALLFTGAIVYLSGRKKLAGGRDILHFTATDALIIGTIQGLAIAPGISRSGMTIAAALFLGLSRELGAKYSFILSIPAIVGAVLLESQGVRGPVNWVAFGAGLITAGLVGYAALGLLVRLIKKGEFKWFAFWCWGVGSLALVWSLI